MVVQCADMKKKKDLTNVMKEKKKSRIILRLKIHQKYQIEKTFWVENLKEEESK